MKPSISEQSGLDAPSPVPAPPDHNGNNSLPIEFDGMGPDLANDVVRRIVNLRAYQGRIQAWCQEEQRRAEREEEEILFRYAGMLDAWLRRELRRRGNRTKTVHLPAGKVSFRQQPPHANIADQARLLAWCEVYLPSALRLEVSASGAAVISLREAIEQCAVDKLVATVQLDPLKRHIVESGEVPDGVEWQPGRDRLLIA